MDGRIVSEYKYTYTAANVYSVVSLYTVLTHLCKRHVVITVNRHSKLSLCDGAIFAETSIIS